MNFERIKIHKFLILRKIMNINKLIIIGRVYKGYLIFSVSVYNKYIIFISIMYASLLFMSFVFMQICNGV